MTNSSSKTSACFTSSVYQLTPRSAFHSKVPILPSNSIQKFSILWIDCVRTMKLFQNFEKLLKFAVARDEKTTLLSILLPQLCLAFGMLSTSLFLLFEADGFAEYSEAFFPFVTCVTNLYGITILIGYGPQIFALIDHLEIIVKERKRKVSFFIMPLTEKWFNMTKTEVFAFTLYNRVAEVKSNVWENECNNWKMDELHSIFYDDCTPNDIVAIFYGHRFYVLQNGHGPWFILYPISCMVLKLNAFFP